MIAIVAVTMTAWLEGLNANRSILKGRSQFIDIPYVAGFGSSGSLSTQACQALPAIGGRREYRGRGLLRLLIPD